MSQQKLIISSTFTAEPVEKPLRFLLDELRIPAALEFAPYNQVFQQLLDPQSLLSQNRDGVNILLVRFEDWGEADPESTARELAEAVKGTAQRIATPVLVCVCPASAAAAKDGVRAALCERLLADLRAAWAGSRTIRLITATEMAGLYPVDRVDDPESEKLGRIPYTSEFFHALALMLARHVYRRLRQPHKVLVLDCDQTIWKGICGEDGPQGIEIDEPRRALQEFAVALHKAGTLICLASKNNQSDVDAVFERRGDMPLRPEHIVASRINWQPKSANIASLAAELNLGLDSFVFVDDDPVVCAEVRANCPEVLVLQLPQDPAGILAMLRHVWAFDREEVTREDEQRTSMYRQNVERERVRGQSLNLGAFLESLNLKITVAPMNPAQLPRVSQLTQRTNQFNCTTIRRSEAEIRQLLAAGAQCLTVEVRDRFGDYGLVGLAIFMLEGAQLVVDSFMLSCRVLGRGVEHRLVNTLAGIAARDGLAEVVLDYFPTRKNQPALDFLESLGVSYADLGDGKRRYTLAPEFAAGLSLDTSAPPLPAAEEGAGKQSAKVRPAAVPAEALARLALQLNSAKALQEEVNRRLQVRRDPAAVSAPAATDTERLLVGVWEEVLQVRPIGIDDDYFALGGDSLSAVSLFVQISRFTGRQLSLATLFQAPTIRQLAKLLESDGQEWTSLVPIHSEGSRPPLYCMHAAGGNVLFYGDLARALGPDQPVYGLQAQGLDGARPRHNRVEDMAAHYVGEIRSFQPEGPYYLCGSSFGGLVAYEMARRLRVEGEEVALVALFDTYGPGYPRYLSHMTAWRRKFFRLARRVQHHWTSLRALRGAARSRYFRSKAAKALKLFRRGLRRQRNEFAAKFHELTGQSLPSELLKTQDAIQAALNAYVPPPLPGALTLFRADHQPLGIHPDAFLGWQDLVEGEIEVYEVPGFHGAVTVDPHAPFLAEKLAPCLERARLSASVPSHAGARSS